jgi:hypothetical protein
MPSIRIAWINLPSRPERRDAFLEHNRAELDGIVAITVAGAMRYDLTILQRQDGNRHVAAVLLEQAGHPDFLSDHA